MRCYGMRLNEQWWSGMRGRDKSRVKDQSERRAKARARREGKRSCKED